MQWLGLLLSLVVVATLIWPSPGAAPVTGLERWIEPLETTRFDRQGFADLTQHLPDFAAVHAQTHTQWQAVTLPDVIELPATAEINEHTPMARVWYRFRMVIAPHGEAVDAAYAVFGKRMMGGAYAVWANGRLLHANINDWPMQFNSPLYVTLPLEMTTPGQVIEVLIAMPYRLNQGYAVGSIYAGPVPTMANARDWRVFWQKLAPQAATWVMMLVGALSLHLWWARKQDSANLNLALLSAAFFICNCQFFYNPLNNETLFIWYNSIIDSAISWELMLLFFFVSRFSHHRFPRFETALVLGVLVITLVTLPIWNWQKNSLLLQHYFNVVGIVGVTGFVSWLSLKKPSLDQHAITVSVWMLTLFGIHDLLAISAQTRPDDIFLLPFGTLAVALAFMFISQRQHVDALRAVEQFNVSLGVSLQELELQLMEKQAILITMEKSQALLQERQRLVRDMHDGMGSTLMTSMILAEHGQMSSAQTAITLRDCVDELKTVIDSLEPMDNNVLTLLGMLRQRFEDRMKGANLELIWHMGDVPPLPWLHPPQALHVLRIVQESITNVLKHARATQIEVSAVTSLSSAGADQVVITITDNGIGFDTTAQKAGRGLRHIRDRASMLGGSIAIESMPQGGTRVTLLLPGLIEIAANHDHPAGV